MGARDNEHRRPSPPPWVFCSGGGTDPPPRCHRRPRYGATALTEMRRPPLLLPGVRRRPGRMCPPPPWRTVRTTGPSGSDPERRGPLLLPGVRRRTRRRHPSPPGCRRSCFRGPPHPPPFGHLSHGGANIADSAGTWPLEKAVFRDPLVGVARRRSPPDGVNQHDAVQGQAAMHDADAVCTRLPGCSVIPSERFGRTALPRRGDPSIGPRGRRPPCATQCPDP